MTENECESLFEDLKTKTRLLNNATTDAERVYDVILMWNKKKKIIVFVIIFFSFFVAHRC